MAGSQPATQSPKSPAACSDARQNRRRSRGKRRSQVFIKAPSVALTGMRGPPWTALCCSVEGTSVPNWLLNKAHSGRLPKPVYHSLLGPPGYLICAWRSPQAWFVPRVCHQRPGRPSPDDPGLNRSRERCSMGVLAPIRSYYLLFEHLEEFHVVCNCVLSRSKRRQGGPRHGHPITFEMSEQL